MATSPRPVTLADRLYPPRDRHESWRSAVVAVDVVINSKGTFINWYLQGAPQECFGPFDEPMSVPQALHYVATQMVLGKE